MELIVHYTLSDYFLFKEYMSIKVGYILIDFIFPSLNKMDYKNLIKKKTLAFVLFYFAFFFKEMMQ